METIEVLHESILVFVDLPAYGALATACTQLRALVEASEGHAERMLSYLYRARDRQHLESIHDGTFAAGGGVMRGDRPTWSQLRARTARAHRAFRAGDFSVKEREVSSKAIEAIARCREGTFMTGRDGMLRYIPHGGGDFMHQSAETNAHAADVWCCEVWPEAGVVFTGSADQTLRVWDLQGAMAAQSDGRTRAQPLQIDESHFDSVFSLTTAHVGGGGGGGGGWGDPSARRLVSGSWDGFVRVFRWAPGGGVDDGDGLELVEREKSDADAVWRLDTDLGDPSCVFSGSWTGSLKHWDLATMEATTQSESSAPWTASRTAGLQGAVVDMQCVAPGVAVALNRRNVLRRWDCRSPASQTDQCLLTEVHLKECTRFRFLPEHRVFLTGHENGAVRGWDLRMLRQPTFCCMDDAPSTRARGFGGGMSKAVLSMDLTTFNEVLVGRFDGLAVLLTPGGGGIGGGGGG